MSQTVSVEQGITRTVAFADPRTTVGIADPTGTITVADSYRPPTGSVVVLLDPMALTSTVAADGVASSGVGWRSTGFGWRSTGTGWRG